MERGVEIIAGNTVLIHIVDICTVTSVVVLFLLMIRPLMKRLPRIGMYILWFLVFVRILCPATVNGIYGLLPEKVEQSIGSIGSYMQVEGIVEKIEMRRRSTYGGNANGYRLPKEIQIRREDTPRLSPREDKAGKPAALERTTAVRGKVQETDKGKAMDVLKPLRQLQAGEWLLVIWGAGVLCCWLYMVFSILRTRWRYSDALWLHDNVYQHPLADNSFVMGLLSPKIYVSENLSAEDRRYVLCHEQVHIARKDYLVKPLAFTIFSLLWFNPLIWAAYYFMMKDMEISCDEAVIRKLGCQEREYYSHLLLSLASGRRMVVSQNPGFSAGTVKERILSVMRYRRPGRAVTVMLCAAVVLCGCGIVSEPVKKAESMPEKQEKGLWVEKDMGVGLDDEAAEEYNKKHRKEGEGEEEETILSQRCLESVMDSQGKLVRFIMLDEEKEKEVSYSKFEGNEDGGWSKVENTWSAEYKKRFPGRNYSLERYKYGGDGFLYLYVVRYNLCKADARYTVDQGKSLRVLERHLMRVDEEEGTMAEMPVMQEPEGEMDFAVASDGTILLVDQTNQAELYNGRTLEKTSEFEMPQRMSCVYAGDGFWAYLTYDQKSKKIQIRLLDEGGDRLQDFTTDVEYKGEARPFAALGVKDNTVILACGEGIYEAEPGENKLRYILGHETDNIYYLWSELYGYVVLSVFKGDNGDYYAGMKEYREDTDTVISPDEGPYDPTLFLHYSQLGDTDGGGTN